MSLLFLTPLKSVPRGGRRHSRTLAEAFHDAVADRTASLRFEFSRTTPRFISVQSVCLDVAVVWFFD